MKTRTPATRAIAATDALVTGYFENIVDVFQRPNTRLYSWLKPRLVSRQIRGIVLWHFTGCDLWRAEAQTLREILGLPVLLLEADEAAGLSPRDVNRLQAFVEMLNMNAASRREAATPRPNLAGCVFALATSVRSHE